MNGIETYKYENYLYTSEVNAYDNPLNIKYDAIKQEPPTVSDNDKNSDCESVAHPNAIYWKTEADFLSESVHNSGVGHISDADYDVPAYIKKEDIVVKEEFESNTTKCELSETPTILIKSEQDNLQLPDPLQGVLQCDICRHQFTTAVDFIGHRFTHTFDNKYTCLICYKYFMTKISLSNHLLPVHMNIKPHKCDICHKPFNHHTSLTYHKRIHSIDRPYECDICHKGFVYRGYLTVHKRIHFDEKQFACDICHKRFKQKSSLGRHKRIHKCEEVFECEICHKRFTRSNSLVDHRLRDHGGDNPYECDICHSRFKLKCNLTAHMLIHTGQKAFECDVCHKRFYRNCALTRHKIYHSGEKPFGCLVCSKRFYQNVALIKHLLLHVDEKRS